MSWTLLPPTVTLTNEIYQASLSKEVRVLFAMQSPQGMTDRLEAAKKLAIQGYIIDVPLMVWGEDAPTWMLARKLAGYTWVNSLLQESGGGSGPIPAGAVKVSIDAVDFPSADPPPPPTTPPVIGNSFGWRSTFIVQDVARLCDVFSAAVWEKYPEGEKHVDSTGTYYFHYLGSDVMDPRNRVAVWLKPVA